MSLKLAERMQILKASEIREILKITQKEDVISFAGGLPAPEFFPVNELESITINILREFGAKALQYSTTEGFVPLREAIAERMNIVFKTNVQKDNILITNGSQQAIDFAGRLFLDKDDIVLCESPTYLAALGAFKTYMPQIVGVKTDNNGICMEDLENKINNHKNIKFIYIIPDFQNPTGKTWSLERRKDIVLMAHKYNIAIIEDNPYGELRFEGELLPAVKAFDEYGIVTYISTFSKTFCPGMRIGWLAASSELYDGYVRLKQGADLHTSTISQMQIYKFINEYNFDEHIKSVTNLYKTRRDLMLCAMEKYFPEEVSFTRPQGGLFIWVEVPLYIDTMKLLHECLKNSVAFVPGASFFPDEKITNTFRLSFSNMSEEKIEIGIRKIADILIKFIK